MFSFFRSSKYKNYKPVGSDSPPPPNTHHSHHKSHRFQLADSKYIIGALSLAVIVLLYLLTQQSPQVQTNPDHIKLQRALTIAEESSRILLDKHSHEMKTNLLEIEQKETKISELETKVLALNKEIEDLSCAAGRVDTAPPADDTLRAKDYTLPAINGVPGLTLQASADSEPGLNHIMGQYRNDQYHIAQLSLTAEDLVIDVGAHVGCFALTVAKRFPETTVVALEPVPSNFHFLKANAERLGLSNVILINKGVSSHGHPMRFWLNPGNTGGSSAFEEHASHEFCVPTTTLTALLDQFVPHKNHVILNMDCEGCEFDSIDSTLLDRVTYLQVETHEHMQRVLPQKLKDKMGDIARKASGHKRWY